MGDLQRRLAFGDLRDRVQRRRPALRRQVQQPQRLRIAEQARRRLQDHAILGGLGEDGRDDALAERRIERVVHRGRGDVETGGGVAIDVDEGGRSFGARIGGDVADLGDRLQRCDDALGLGIDVRRVRSLDREAILSRPAFRIDRQILRRLEVERQAGDLVDRLLEPAHHLFLGVMAVLEVDQHRARIECGVVRAVDAHKGGQRLDVLVVQDRVRRLPLQLRHAIVGDAGGRDDARLQLAGVLRGEQALGDDEIEQRRQNQRRDRHHQRGETPPEHEIEPACIMMLDPAERIGGTLRDAARAFGAMFLEPARRQHRGERQRNHRRDQDRHRQRHRELAEQAADDIAHEQERDQHRDQRDGERDDREADLACALQRRVERLHAVLDMALDILDHHDRVVDDEASRDGERHQR